MRAFYKNKHQEKSSINCGDLYKGILHSEERTHEFWPDASSWMNLGNIKCSKTRMEKQHVSSSSIGNAASCVV